MIINGHKVTQKTEAGEAVYMEIDDGKAEFVNVAGIGISGTAWDAEQKRIIQETLPNVKFQSHPNEDGLEVWKFYGTP